MKQLDKLILLELIGPWVFGVAIFTVMVMAGTILFQLTSYIVSGIDPRLIAELFFLLMPAILAKTLAMAMLLAALLAFGRFSGDSEIVALKAGGASVPRMMVPVLAFGLAVGIIAFALNEQVVPRASFAAQSLKAQIEKKVHGQPQFTAIWNENKLRAMMMAEDFNLPTGTLKGVTVKAFDNNGNPSFILLAPSMKYTDEQHWELGPGAVLISADGSRVLNLGATYPISSVAEPPKPEDILAVNLKDLDTFSMAQMAERIRAAKTNPTFKKDQLANLEYGYYNKIALPLATLVFALLGATLGIRSHRTGTATGFWLSVIIIFAYMFMANWMNIYAMGGVVPPYVASFLPCIVGFVVGAILMVRKNH